ncbi:efflux RND transporter periplasmic adaptor subunit [Ramlibacter rhizophilus]|uniref:Efflux RND transporter periplasmic adaptor subunit n=1 Tax=Ramlibacter rhizophilus TaxID=1781167 RepID=A0A4Z0BDF1_9BURK|nr:efflux RND transporter periplasmic adaptor subunit [Ramlibacter rhizophilus]
MRPSPAFSLRAARACAPVAGWLLLVATLAGCSRPPPPPEPVRSVKVLTVAASPWQSAREFSAEVRPRVETRLGFRVGGKMLDRAVEPGQRVRGGQLLARLDAQDFQLASEAARAQVQAATTQRDLAAADLRRYASLREQNFISGAELERREATLRAAQAQLDQAQAQLSVQGNQARYAALAAPAAGVVTSVDAEPGQVLAAGAPVLRLALDGPRDAVFAIPEDQLSRVRPGLPVSVRQWSDGKTLAGQVREVSASADPATRTYQVKVAIAGDAPPLGATVYLKPHGMDPTGLPVIKLPTSALRQEGKGSAVWLLDAATMTVRLQPVEIAGIDGNEAVVASGLQPGMQVVTAGVHALAPGQKVTLWQAR